MAESWTTPSVIVGNGSQIEYHNGITVTTGNSQSLLEYHAKSVSQRTIERIGLHEMSKTIVGDSET